MADLKSLKRELQREFRALGIAPSDVLWSELCLKEMSKCLRPEIHEGRIPPYGAVIGGGKDVPDEARAINLGGDQLKLGRTVADGVRTFTMFNERGFRGLLFLDTPAMDELTLVNLREVTDSVVLTRDADGVTRVFLQIGIVVHRHRNWSFRPAVDLILQKLHKTCPAVRQPAFAAVLRFAFHQLSPLKTGATLVWCLTEPSSADLGRMRPAIDLTQLRADVSEEAVLPSMRHLLAQVDGATIISHQGMFLGTGAQLQPSMKSKRLVPEHQGTRHTSARRFSYDFDAGILVVVSSDGAVSIFSDGASLADLRAMPTRSAAELLRKNDGSQSLRSVRHRCSGCGKTCVVESSVSNSSPNRNLRCPVCHRSVPVAVGKPAEVYIVKAMPSKKPQRSRRV
jgi:DNA integrity scanning protein DisA with diadenylate cyclase activity